MGGIVNYIQRAIYYLTKIKFSRVLWRNTSIFSLMKLLQQRWSSLAIQHFPVDVYSLSISTAMTFISGISSERDEFVIRVSTKIFSCGWIVKSRIPDAVACGIFLVRAIHVSCILFEMFDWLIVKGIYISFFKFKSWCKGNILKDQEQRSFVIQGRKASGACPHPSNWE